MSTADARVLVEISLDDTEPPQLVAKQQAPSPDIYESDCVDVLFEINLEYTSS